MQRRQDRFRSVAENHANADPRIARAQRQADAGAAAWAALQR